MDEFQIEDIRGRNVVDNQGRVMGSVADVAVDTREWRVRGLVVDVKRDVADAMGLPHGFLRDGRLEVRPNRVQAVGEAVLLNLSAEDMGRLLGGR